MPGTILVSVLEFKGLHSTPPHVSIKVTIGRREYRIRDREDFSFPLTSLRDNLTIALHDSEGNEMTHTDVETRLVVEKGLWYNIFHLEGGWHVHLKLQFVLSDEERNRIRAMRESAMRKKQGELSTGRATIVHTKPNSPLRLKYEVSDPQKTILQSEVTNASVVSSSSDVTETDREETLSTLKMIQIDTRRVHHQPSTSQSSDLTVVSKSKSNSPPKEKQNPVGKTHSKVRNMITAFEGNLAQDTRSSKAKVQSNKIGDLKNKLKLKEAATVSGRENLWNRGRSGGNLSVKEESGKALKSEPLEKAANERASIDKMKFIEKREDSNYPFECPGTWIFPVQSTHLCVTTSSKQILDLMDHCHLEPSDARKSNEGENAENSKLFNAADEEQPTRGPLGQAIRTAIMIGFAALVIFTGQRNTSTN